MSEERRRDSYSVFESLLNKKGITSYRVSKDLDISPMCLSDWKNGKSMPKVDKLKKIADYFEVEIESFLE